MSGTSISGTTPFPNVLLDEVLPRLKDTEWRLLCVVVRQTLGHYDYATKARKERDWITRAQLKARTGRNTEALSLAIETLVSQGYITAQNGRGRPLPTPAERRKNHSRIYYGLSEEWKEKLDCERGRSELAINKYSITQHFKSEQHPQKSSLFVGQTRKSELVNAGKPDTTKETLTKENQTKETNDRDYSNAPGRLKPSGQGKGFSVKEPSVQAVAGQVFLSEDENDSERAKRFISLFENLVRQSSHGKPDTALSRHDARRLEKLMEKHAALDWTPFLQMFFESDLSYMTQRNYSLLAFLNTCNVFLARSP